MRAVKLFLRKYFGFTQKEVNGYIILQFLLIIILFFPYLTSKFYSTIKTDNSKDIQHLDSLISILESQPSTYRKVTPSTKKSLPVSKENIAIKLFKFNPNSITVKEFMQLGLKKNIAERIIKYREKGGVFKIKKDLTKIYNFPLDIYNKLEPYILLPTKKIVITKKENKVSQEVIGNSAVRVRKEKVFKKPEIIAFDINSADSLQLIQINGIGAKISTRIIKFRNKLGGFHKKEQLKEVYGLNDEVYNRIIKHSHLKESSIKKIPINNANIKTLISHPYINYNQAKVIVNYRDQHGKYHELNDLKKLKVVDQTFLNKIEPYLSFN